VEYDALRRHIFVFNMTVVAFPSRQPGGFGFRELCLQSIVWRLGSCSETEARKLRACPVAGSAFRAGVARVAEHGAPAWKLTQNPGQEHPKWNGNQERPAMDNTFNHATCNCRDDGCGNPGEDARKSDRLAELLMTSIAFDTHRLCYRSHAHPSYR
jgi:hypothetical protein